MPQTASKDAPRPFWKVALIVAIVGLLVYLWATSLKPLREPFDFAWGVEDPVFSETFGSLVGAPFQKGNRIEVLRNGEEFFPAMLNDIRKATRSINLESFIWTSGKVSDQFIAALVERAQAGVAVRVLVDGIGSLNFEDSDQVRLKDGGVEFIKYGREHWYDIKANFNQRTHRKLLMIDGRIGYTGGAGIEDTWLGSGEHPDFWRDTQVRVEGPAVLQMQAAFVANWMEASNRILAGADYFPTVEPPSGALAHCFRSGPDENAGAAQLAYVLAIAGARRSIKIAQAYFIPDGLSTEMLLRARERGVEVEVIVPHLTDSAIGKAASRSRWGPLLEAGVRMSRYKPAPYHCKVMIVDDAFVTVGSINFDNRSFAINDEANVVVIDREIAARFSRDFAEDWERSEPISPEGFKDRSVFVKLFDHACGLVRSQL